ncbi:nitrogen fixation protein NifM [Musicola keenii]|uniref:nitrogen fixation protein NifM n=1 Tax=Musicola keenii TaxID=2884250 RepID=UPI001CE2B5B3|nr:nitrogen fixation protein NifM [Musicola keenii]
MESSAWRRFSRLRLAQARFHCLPDALPPQHQDDFQRQLARQCRLEQAVVEAARCQPLAVTDDMLQLIEQQLAEPLAQADFAPEERQAVIRHHALMELQLTWVAAQAAAPTGQDVVLWYRQHADRFLRPEQRLTHHLLLTAEDERTATLVRAQIRGFHRTLCREPAQFERLARRYSHCPSALEGGLLGWVSRGLLFSELEQSLFMLREGQVSEPVETEIGWHLLWCETIRPEAPLPESEALPKASDYLLRQRQRQQQRQWLATLLADESPVSGETSVPE